MSYYMPTEEQIQKTMKFFGFDRLVAIRHLQGQRLALEHHEAQRQARYLESQRFSEAQADYDYARRTP